LQKGFNIAVDAYKVAGIFPNSKEYSLAQQVTGSAVSIPSDIAEGSSRSSGKDYNRFLEISLGSAYELEMQLLISRADLVMKS
jgi:four helix bundle protein